MCIHGVHSRELDKKVCEIINDRFSWIMKVDGQTIYFDGGDSAEYFGELYTSLGYDVVWDRERYKQEF